MSHDKTTWPVPCPNTAGVHTTLALIVMLLCINWLISVLLQLSRYEIYAPLLRYYHFFNIMWWRVTLNCWTVVQFCCNSENEVSIWLVHSCSLEQLVITLTMWLTESKTELLNPWHIIYSWAIVICFMSCRWCRTMVQHIAASWSGLWLEWTDYQSTMVHVYLTVVPCWPYGHT